MAPIRLYITTGCAVLLWAVFCFFASGCSTGSHYARPTEVAASDDQAASQDADSGTQPKAAKSGRQKTSVKKTYDNKTGREGDRSVLRADGTDLASDPYSLYRKSDTDADLTPLLTDDYLKQFDIPIVLNDAVQYFVRYYMTEKKKVFTNWLRRSRRYIPMIKEIMRRHGLPEDLVYVAMIESGFNPKAYSSAKACGPWQFIYETGGRYGLRVNHWVDERRDPEKSTIAAALYLRDLFNQFGSWNLAAAAYNAGEKRIERTIEMYQTSDFFELMKYNTLPKETREYIPRLLAAALVAKSPEKFGFTGLNYDEPVRFASEGVPGGIPLDVLARAAWTDVESLRSLNPELLTNVTPPDVATYTINLPESTPKDRFRASLTASMRAEKRVKRVQMYTFKKKDKLVDVMGKHDVSFDDLLLVNTCDREIKAKVGAVVYIPSFYGSRRAMETARDTTGGENAAQPDKTTESEAKAQPEPNAQPEARPPSRCERAAGEAA